MPNTNFNRIYIYYLFDMNSTNALFKNYQIKCPLHLQKEGIVGI